MRVSQIIILSAIFLFTSCGTSAVPPTDNELIQHFYTHESAFNQIKELISECPNNLYYPPYHSKDTICLIGISAPIQKKLDSLLFEIGCKRIFYTIKTNEQGHVKEPPNVELSIQYFTSGYSVGGTAKDFVYSSIVERLFPITENRELNDIYQTQYNDTILYKSIKGNWFIRLIHDN